jgi:hypothetical protein
MTGKFAGCEYSKPFLSLFLRTFVGMPNLENREERQRCAKESL